MQKLLDLDQRHPSGWRKSGAHLLPATVHGHATARTLPVSLLRMHNDTLDPVDELKRPLTTVLQRLRSLAPAAVEDRVRGGYAGGGRCILAPHDADENADRGSGVATRDRANFEKSPGLSHLGCPVDRPGSLVRCHIGSIGDRILPRRAERNWRKIRPRVAGFWTRDDLDDVEAHENSSDIAMTTRPMSASEIK
jgi:hypothetical protein